VFASKICIDPGHGGSDPGASGQGLVEKAVNLDVGLRLKAWFDADSNDDNGGGDWNPMMTRSTDVYVSLSGRTSFANSNSCERFMCIHSNAWTYSSANGIETFCWGSGDSGDFDLRNKVYQEAVAMWPLTQRGTKTANFYVTIYSNMPSELHEMGFITNPTDASYLGSGTHRNNHALSELYACQRSFGQAKYRPGTGGGTNIIVDNLSGGFSASANWWTGAYGNYYGSNYHIRGTASVSDAATFGFNLSSSGSYKVYAWWADGSNRAANIAYMVYHSGGTANVYVNQRTNGGQWNYLGQWSFNGGSNNVKLSCWATSGYYSCADAVKITN
jgi:N-acetylmuramoyl-L-alanine amidase